MEKILNLIQIISRVAISICFIGIILMSFKFIEIQNKLFVNLIDLTKISQELNENIHELEFYNSHLK